MANLVKHLFANPKPDGPDVTITRPSDWNAAHVLVLDGVAAGTRLGTSPDRWYSSLVTNAANLSSGAPAVGTFYALPFLATKAMTVDTLAVLVTSATATAKIRVGIYADDGNLYPSSLVGESGELDVGTTGKKSGAVSLALAGGALYWLATLQGVAASTIRAHALTTVPPILGLDTTIPNTWGVGWTVAQTYGALPASFPAGATAITAVPLPAVFLRGI